MAKNWIANANTTFEQLILIIQAVALLIITVATGVAIVAEGYEMFSSKTIGLANLLLLFLFIEILSMVRQYALGQHELKLKTPLVITVVAVARYLTVALLISRKIRGMHDDEVEEKIFEQKLQNSLSKPDK